MRIDGYENNMKSYFQEVEVPRASQSHTMIRSQSMRPGKVMQSRVL